MGLASCCTSFECQEHTATLERQLAEAQDGWGKATAAALQLDEALAEARKAEIEARHELQSVLLKECCAEEIISLKEFLAEARKAAAISETRESKRKQPEATIIKECRNCRFVNKDKLVVCGADECVGCCESTPPEYEHWQPVQEPKP